MPVCQKYVCEDFCPVCIPAYLHVEIVSYECKNSISVHAAKQEHRSPASITKLPR